jgi:hypothetical protein
MGGGTPHYSRFDTLMLTFRPRHLMTGIGAYFYLTWGIWLRHCLNGKQDEYELVWPRVITSVPLIVRKGTQDVDVKKSL